MFSAGTAVFRWLPASTRHIVIQAESREEREPVTIAALNQYVFCPRRCALMFVEGIWNDNEHTAIGSLLHDHTDEPGYETDEGVTLLRALPLFSNRYGLVGKADIVEVRAKGEGQRGKGQVQGAMSKQQRANGAHKSAIRNPQSAMLYAPVEYKKGKRRKWDNDDVQLCAQALCLEEMFQTEVPRGFIYHAASKRRREVIFNEALRAETVETIENVRALLRQGRVPPAVLMPRCNGCSLREVCMPEITQAHNPAPREYEREVWT